MLATPGLALAQGAADAGMTTVLEPVHMGMMFYLGTLAAMLLYNLLLFFTVHDRGYLEYAAFTFGMAFGQVALNGFGTQLLWNEAGIWAQAAQPAGFALAGLCAALFTRGFLHTGSRAPNLDLTLKAAALLFGAALAGAFMLPSQYSNTFISLAGPLFGVLAVVCGLRCRQLRAPGAALYLAGWSTMLVGVAVFAAMRMGWFAENGLTLHAMEITSALGILMLSFALAERTGAKWRERAMTQGEALAASEHLIESLQTSEQFLTQGMAQRSLELEALTLRLQESEQRLQQVSHHDPLTGLANQLLLTDRIDQGIIRSKRHNCRTAVIMLDLDDFKPVNDAYGREVGDEILKAVAVRLRGIVREQDTVGRPDSDQFVIVLEEVFDADDLQRVANAVAAEFVQPFRVGEHTITIGASLGSAISPDGGTTATSLLKQAGKLMRRCKEGKRLHRDQGGSAGVVAA